MREEWSRDPKHVSFVLARYKFVSKMLAGFNQVLEVGAGDGFASELVAREVRVLRLTDKAPRASHVEQSDILAAIPSGFNDAIYCVDVIEHIHPDDSRLFMRNLAMGVVDRGTVIVGTPSLESQRWASEDSRREHINCFTFERLRDLMREYFYPVFMFCQNDEVIHTGFPRLAHYLWAVGVR